MLEDDLRELIEAELEDQLAQQPTNEVVVGVINPGNPNPYKDDCDV